MHRCNIRLGSNFRNKGVPELRGYIGNTPGLGVNPDTVKVDKSGYAHFQFSGKMNHKASIYLSQLGNEITVTSLKK